MIKFIITIAITFLIIFFYSFCNISSREDRWREKLEKEEIANLAIR